MQTKEVKKKVIREIQNSKFIAQLKSKFWNKESFIEDFNNFKIEDFKLYASDGNTEIHPDEYFKVTSKNKLKREYDSNVLQMKFHEINGERGVNLLNCCGECRDLFLRNLFEINYYNNIGIA